MTGARPDPGFPMMRPATVRALILAGLTVACGGSTEAVDVDTPAAPTPPSGPRTFVLVSLDTLRPERLGVYGGREGVSPVIDALARESVVFDQAIAPSPWTLPSHMTMLTGLDPVAHGVINDSHRLSDEVTTLAESLQAQGFRTAAFTDGGFVAAKYGFDQGFDLYDDQRAESVNGFPRLMPLALDWVSELSDEDAFLFLHTFDAHTPYDETAPEILERFRALPVEDGPTDHGLFWLSHLKQQVKVGVTTYPRMGDLLNDYDAGVHEADLWLGRLIDRLKAQGRWDNTLVLVTSDHGEAFLDHGLHVGHGLGVKDAEVRVPLILRLPGGEAAGTRHGDLVGLIDVTRTMIEAAGGSADEVTQGESLMGLVQGRPRRVQHVLGASTNVRSWFLVQNGFKYVTPVGVKPMLIAERHLGPTTPAMLLPPAEQTTYTIDGEEARYDMAGDPLGLLDVLPSAEQLYDRGLDPGERRDLAREPGFEDVVERMRGLYLAAHQRSTELHGRFETEAVELDPSERRVLATLGYMQSGDQSELEGVSKTMRRWVTDPHVAPDTSALAVADRAVHAVRIHGAVPGSGQKLLEAGRAYVGWALTHPAHANRADWRLVALRAVADEIGAELPTDEWIEALRKLPR